MTTVETVGVEDLLASVEKPCAMKRGELDERDRAICVAVWEFFDEHGYGMSYRELSRIVDRSKSTLIYRVKGIRYEYDDELVPMPHSRRPGGGLIERGWCTSGDHYAPRSLRPGPRFVALVKTHGGQKYPMEWSS